MIWKDNFPIKNRYFETENGILYCNDVVEQLSQFTNESIDLVVSSPPYDCYSDDTEVLTENGWKYIKDVKVGENVLTLAPRTREVYFCEVVKTFSYNVTNEELIHFYSQDIDLMVTKNHKMFVTDLKGFPARERKPFIKKEFLSSFYLREAKDIKTSNYLPASGFIWKGEEKDFFILPKVTCKYNKQLRSFKPKKISMLWWVRFLGIYLAEGACRGTKGGLKNGKPKLYEITIKQKDEKNVLLIREILNHLPFKFKERISANGITIFSITNRQLWEYLFKLGNSYTKYIPKEIKRLDSFYLREFLYYYLIGDGTKRRKHAVTSDLIRRNFCNAKSFFKRLKDDLQEICIKIGFYTKLLKRNYISFTKYNYLKYASFKKNIVRYTGKIVCLQVKKDNIICVRRNGKVVFCGNSLRYYSAKDEKGLENIWNFEKFKVVAKELYRIMKKGGVVVWVIGDATIKGSESGNSFKQALYFKDSCGFKLHDTMIYLKHNFSNPSSNRYHQVFEYMFVFVKDRLKIFNPIKDRKNKWAGHSCWGRNTVRTKDGELKEVKKRIVTEYGMRHNVWKYNVGYGFGQKDKIAYKHPATFPEQLAYDHIVSWSNEGDIVLDPLCGSGTTLKMTEKLNRKWVGIEINPEYCEIVKERLVDNLK